MKKHTSGLRTKMLKISLFPIFIMGVIILIFSSNSFSKGMNTEVENGMENVAAVILNTYNTLYPGDYELVGDTELSLEKGGVTISGNYDIIDSIKEETGLEITLFYQDARILTTLKSSDGTRLIGTGAHAKIKTEVLEAQEQKFYHNVLINETTYFAFYEPLFNADGTCVGMLGVAKPASYVSNIIWKALLPIIIIAVICMLFTAWISIRFTDSLTKVIGKIKEFLGLIATGELSSQIDYTVLNRTDELGEMGRFTVNVQKSLRELMEFDALTGLYNRRFGELKLRQIIEKHEKNGNSFCIALGDIDFFKKFNETYGHECGDTVLKCVAAILKNGLSKKGFAARWGGEEFLIVLERTSLHDAEEELQSIMSSIRNAGVIFQGQPLNITMTIGVSEGTGESDLHKLLLETDEKLYQGKINGRNKLVK